MQKLNCWEFKKCGRENGGSHVQEFGVCPAISEIKLDKVHNGKNAGRTCWVVSGTFCNGVKQGTFAQKEENCSKCDFYQIVRNEEGDNFMLAGNLKKIMREGK